MIKSQWIAKAAESSHISKKDMTLAYNALFETLQQTLLSGESVQIPGLGTFVVREKEACTVRNPKSGALVLHPNSRRVVFLTGKTLKDKLNET